MMAMGDGEVRRLVVMRHAKAQGTAASDEARRLTGQGRADARSAGAWLVARQVTPSLVLVSSATRARETAAEVCAALLTTPAIEPLPELYDGGADDVLELCRQVPADTTCLMVIGHNPTVSELLQVLVGDARSDRPESLPAAGLAVVACAGEWESLLRSAHVEQWHVPAG
jgi:phosphohistidine phosphatase